MHFGRYIPFWSRRRGDELFMSCDGETLSWNELDRASAALAAYLAESGVQRGDRFGCLLGNSLAWCVGYAASLRLGTIFVPLNPMFGPFELQQIEADAACGAILSCPSQITKLGVADDAEPEQPRIYHRGAAPRSIGYAEVIATPRRFVDAALPDDDIMLISYTSGTTGVPKGVALTHRSVDAAMQGAILSLGMIGGEERLLILAPLAFTGGVVTNLSNLIAIGGSGYLEKAVDPARALKRLIDHRISFLIAVPALWERIAMAPDFASADLSSLHVANTGGAPVSRKLMDTFLAKGVTIRQQYGFTEACGGVSAPTRAIAAARPESCGHALAAIELEIRNAQGQRVRGDEVGEIHARGPQMMQGYWNKPDTTAEAYDGDWYKTGDLAKYDCEDGIVLVDRKKNMLISGGVNIYPAEVERAIAQIPGVVEAVVLGIDSAQWGQEVAAIVYAPTLSDAAALVTQLRQMLGSYKAPKQLRLSAQPLPKTSSNKIARTGLEALFATLPPS